MVLPEPGFHDGLRELTRRFGTLLLIDETHTISSGLGGYTQEARAGARPVRARQADRRRRAGQHLGHERRRRRALQQLQRDEGAGLFRHGHDAVGQSAAIRGHARHARRDHDGENYDHMERLAARLERGLRRTIARYGLPWHVARVGARVEFICAPGPLRNGGEAEAAHAPDLEAAIHVALVNRGALIAPFHNMMLVSPATEKPQVDRLVAAFGDIAERLAA